MNTNELADGIERCTTDPLHKQAATMLRQQQAEKEELEVGLKNVWKIVENKQAEIEALKAELRGIDELIIRKVNEE